MKLFFDVDGVLINGWHANPALRRPWNANLAEDMQIDAVRFETLLFRHAPGTERSLIQECALGERDLLETLATILPQVGYTGPVPDFVAYWFEKDSVVNSALFDIIAMLRAKPGITVYIATGQEHHRADYLWNTLGFSRHFDRMFYSAELGHAKKDVRFFQHITATLAIGPNERPVIVDDQREVVEVARRVGWEGIVFETTEEFRRHPRIAALLD